MNSAADDRYLCFVLGPERFGIPLLNVREVIGVPEFTRMPYAPAYFKGLLNLRGQVIATVDLRQKFGFQIQSHPENAVIVCELGDTLMGAIVDNVDFVFQARESDIQSKLAVDSNMKVDYIAGLFNHKKGLVMVLDLKKVLSIQDTEALRTGANTANTNKPKASA